MMCSALSLDTGSSLRRYNLIDSTLGRELFCLQHENRQLFLGKEFYKFQTEERERDNEILFSKVKSLERLLNERKNKDEEEQNRLVTKHESDIAKMREECEEKRNDIKKLKDQVNKMTEHEGQMIKELAGQRLLLENNQPLLDSVQKENEDMNLKLLQYESERQDGCSTCISIGNEVSNLNSEIENKTSEFLKKRLGYKKLIAGKEAKLQQEKVMTEKCKAELIEMKAALIDQTEKTKFLYERVKKVDEIAKANKLYHEKEQTTKKENQQLKKKILMLRKEKKLKDQEATQSEVFLNEIKRIQKERTELQRKFEKEMKTASKESIKTKKVIEDFKQLLKDRESKLQNVERELENTRSDFKQEQEKSKDIEKKYENILKQVCVEEKNRTKRLHASVNAHKNDFSQEKSEQIKDQTDIEEERNDENDLGNEDEREVCEEYMAEDSVSEKSISKEHSVTGEKQFYADDDYDEDFEQETFCEESVASYTSDESDKSGLFFGSKKIQINNGVIEESDDQSEDVPLFFGSKQDNGIGHSKPSDGEVNIAEKVVDGSQNIETTNGEVPTPDEKGKNHTESNNVKTNKEKSDKKTKEGKALMGTLVGEKPAEESPTISTTFLHGAPQLSKKDSIQCPSSVDHPSFWMSKSSKSEPVMNSSVNASSLNCEYIRDEVLEKKATVRTSKKKKGKTSDGELSEKTSVKMKNGDDKISASDIFGSFSTSSVDRFEDDELESDINAILGCL